MSTLTEFLMARIAEDEAVAREATPGAWRVDRRGDIRGGRGDGWVVGGDYMAMVDDKDADHIARHNSARVLAECEAKRRIVERQAAYAQVQQRDPVDCPDLRALAIIYADHPEFDEAWRA